MKLITLCRLASVAVGLGLSSRTAAALANGDVYGTVTDSVRGAPLGSAQVTIQSGDRVVVSTLTDAFGHFRAHHLQAGLYTVRVRVLGFRPVERAVTVAARDIEVNVSMAAVSVELTGVTVTAGAPIAIDTRTGEQSFDGNRSHSSPTTTSSQLIQQSVAGAVRAPTGEVHIRGQHAEYTYFLDGVPVPSGVSGSLNELFDPAIVNSITFKTGGWDAEYGNKNAAIIDVTTKIPVGDFHLNASGFGGSFATNGQSVNASANQGTLGFFGAVSRQVTDMRREPVAFDTTTFRPYNFHNRGEDLFGFGKVQWNPSGTDVVNLEGNWTRSKFQVPFDSAGGNSADDRQTDVNTFLNLGWRHHFESTTDDNGKTHHGGEFFASAFYRYGSLKYAPGLTNDPQFVFFPDTNRYNLSENRNFTTFGAKIDYTARLSEMVEFRTGVLSQFTSGQEDFVTSNGQGQFGPASSSNLSGSDIGVYAQTALSPNEHLELRTGVRYDAHTAPFAGTKSQVSPRARLNLFFDPANTLYLFYGRLFVPTNVEDLRAITSVAQAGVIADPTLPERDHFYEMGYIHRFPFGVVTKLSVYYKQSSPGIDDNTVPGSAIVTSVNIEQVRITGLESVIEIRPKGPLTGNVNLAINHAYGYGRITGGFFPTDAPDGKFDLDHDQRISISANAVYSLGAFYLSASETYGSGLTNGVDPADCNCSFGTGLFAFNKGIKVKPNYITNLSGGYSFTAGGVTLRPELFVDNLFDSRYLLKGTFFSGASVGRPRSVQLRVNVGI
ncbi:MAG: TonB-dependent receptor [Gemmatimonadaceae bacterium]|nr:TonB-dependent receptor [Gemmatimonadaceae bacterium]